MAKGSLLNDIKNDVKKSGSNKGKILYFRPGNKLRVRFLEDMDDGRKVLMHSSFNAGINVPCQDIYDRPCQYCNDEELAHKDHYIWQVYDYDANEVKLLMAKVNNCSPVPGLVGMYEAYGTLLDRDYVITKNGSGTSSNFSVVPMDKAKFRNEKAKKMSESKLLDIIDKAFPGDEAAEGEEETPKKKRRNDDDEDDEPKKKTKKRPAEEDDEDEEEELDYEDMTPKQLYKLCVEREIKAKPKKDAEYYIELLEAYDEDDEEEDDEDEWES